MKLKQTGKLAPINQPGKLIRDAIDDLKLQENTPLVGIDMSVWHKSYHSYAGGYTCFQCLAGCVISRRLDTDTKLNKCAESFEKSIADRLGALDSFRRGEIGHAYTRLGLTLPKHLPKKINVTDYHEDKKQFKKDMLKIADMISKKVSK